MMIFMEILGIHGTSLYFEEIWDSRMLPWLTLNLNFSWFCAFFRLVSLNQIWRIYTPTQTQTQPNNPTQPANRSTGLPNTPSSSRISVHIWTLGGSRNDSNHVILEGSRRNLCGTKRLCWLVGQGYTQAKTRKHPIPRNYTLHWN